MKSDHISVNRVVCFVLSISGLFLAILSNSVGLKFLGAELSTYSFFLLGLFKGWGQGGFKAMGYYLVIQGLGTVLGLISLYQDSFSGALGDFDSHMVMVFVLLWKISLVPFGYWYIPFISMLDKFQAFFLIGCHPVAPLVLLSHLSACNGNKLLPIVALCAVCCTVWGGLGIWRTKGCSEHMCYAYMMHMGWALWFVNGGPLWGGIWLSFMCGVGSVYYVIGKYDLDSFASFEGKSMSPLHKVCLIVGLYSLGAVSPLLGFQLKLFYTVKIMWGSSVILSLFMISVELLSVFRYNHIVMGVLVGNPIELGGSVNENDVPKEVESVTTPEKSENPYSLVGSWYYTLKTVFGRFRPKGGGLVVGPKRVGMIVKLFRALLGELYGSFNISWGSGKTGEDWAQVVIPLLLISVNVFPWFLFCSSGDIGKWIAKVLKGFPW